MERLTKPNGRGEYYFSECWKKCEGEPQDCENCPEDYKICQKLGEYEDAEENGLMVRLPCKVGDTVYVAYPETRNVCNIYPCTVQSIYLTDDNHSKARSHLNIKSHISIFTKRMNLGEIGKTVFLTKEEAEQTLKKRGTVNEKYIIRLK